MFNMYFVSCLLLSLCSVCSAYKILLVFPSPTKSHGILGEAYLHNLVEAGHEVTYIASVPIEKPPAGVRQINVSTNFLIFDTAQISDMKNLMVAQVDRVMVVQLMSLVANNTLMSKEVQALMHDPRETFDAVIVEWLYSEQYAGLASVFDCPLIWSSSMEPHAMVLTLIDEDPNPAYFADSLSDNVPPFTFSQRLQEIWTLMKIKYLRWSNSNNNEDTFKMLFASAAKKRGVTLPTFEEAIHNGSLMLGNSHVSAGLAVSLPPSYVHIAGYHISKQVKPLPNDLQTIMDEAKHGVIYFSMGSILKSESMPKELKRGLLDMFGELKQTVIWKFGENIENAPTNVHIIKWAPQQSILAHNNTRVFITHGGLLSTTEALHFAVPIIGIPMFADQAMNVNRAVFKGFAKRIDLAEDTPIHLKSAIADILNDHKYTQKVKDLSEVYYDRPVHPAKELVHWVEHVVKTKGAPHLRSPALMLPWYKKAHIDLSIALIAIIVFGVTVSGKFFFVKNERNLRKKRN